MKGWRSRCWGWIIWLHRSVLAEAVQISEVRHDVTFRMDVHRAPIATAANAAEIKFEELIHGFILVVNTSVMLRGVDHGGR